MQLPEKIIPLLDELLDDLSLKKVPNSEVIKELRYIVNKHAVEDDQIFVQGKVTDFESLLFAQYAIKELRKENKKLEEEIQSERDESAHWKSEYNKVMNYSKGERKEIMKDRTLQQIGRKLHETKEKLKGAEELRDKLLSLHEQNKTVK